MLVPAFPLLGEPGDWDALTLLAATIALEAEGEPAAGQVGVGSVVMNRLKARWAPTVHAVILGRDEKAYGDGKPWEQWSCWNDDYRTRAEARLAALGSCEWAWRAAAVALWGLTADPTNGATFYLNVPVTKKIRGGTLPSWFREEKVTTVLGRHTFVLG